MAACLARDNADASAPAHSPTEASNRSPSSCPKSLMISRTRSVSVVRCGMARDARYTRETCMVSGRARQGVWKAHLQVHWREVRQQRDLSSRSGVAMTRYLEHREPAAMHDSRTELLCLVT